MWTNGRTDKRKLIVAFRYSVNVPKDISESPLKLNTGTRLFWSKNGVWVEMEERKKRNSVVESRGVAIEMNHGETEKGK
jgi:hypothetical protein